MEQQGDWSGGDQYKPGRLNGLYLASGAPVSGVESVKSVLFWLNFEYGVSILMLICG